MEQYNAAYGIQFNSFNVNKLIRITVYSIQSFNHRLLVHGSQKLG